MKLIWLLLSVPAAFIIHSQVSLWGVVPSLTVAVAYAVGIYTGPAKGILLGSAVGMLEDSVSGNILGPNLMGKGMVGFLASFNSGSFFRWTPLLGMLSLFFLTLLDGVVVWASRTIFETSPATMSRGIFTVLMQGMMNVAIGFFLRPRNVG